MRITYNAPFVLTYTLVCLVITSIDFLLLNNLVITQNFFTVYPFGTAPMSLTNPLAYWRLFSHALGHADFNHLLGNFTFILLLGPILEEKYGSDKLLWMSFLTAFITGILNASLFSSALLGASGIVFMMILLASFTNMRAGTIPLTFLLIAGLFLGKEIYNTMFVENNTSEFAHILGGISGAVFGYIFGIRPKETA
ncbi:rhomboid family intramembrane serine protease [Eisenibacter elegans]|jgi:membrane associated rhomboid family serine protease|uniref:rhomboid family intramembrane serine protease n=1 Tax=Eisenibacter elegans TaxID=997 RepID=UPI000420D080|nr:rhomboid family intramembrane serine protease [Eisenibacter elegans]